MATFVNAIILGMDNEQVTMEILKCVGISAPGPHAFLLTIAIGRFTKEEISTVDLLCNIFGHEMKKHLVLIFTRKDVLHKGKKTIEDLIANAPPYLQTLITECENRYIAWNNYANKEEKTQQTKNLFDVIETLLAQNGSSFYRSEIFEETDNIVIEREREIRDIYEHDYLRRLKQYRRQISQEYQQKLKPYLDRDNDLSTQICSLQEKQEQATKDVQKHLGELSKEIDMLNDTKKGIDNRSSSQVQHLTDMINTSQSKLVENRRLQANLYEEHKTESLNMEREWTSIYREFQPRDEVRKEIEKGNEKILVRFWGNIKRCGQRITDGFIVIFKFFKTKPKTF
ncbi:hypothetical protein KUTeg_020102 [Tegillarca granosa]|uniref:AIG1-type G domain-containing protein n=1 Tax=Tegillarca granosa TaxID=220873 RepID=A0ABQ9E7I5_TEGGR|nr:hypothetical protein KUTeg_020102 [Tegillarca granosa]